MVAQPLPSRSPDDEYYDELGERWPERPSRTRAAKRAYQRKQARQVTVRAERRDRTDVPKISKALRAAERDLAARQVENDARDQENQP